MQKYMQGVVGKKAAAKLVAKGAARLLGVGTALLAYDAFTVLSSYLSKNLLIYTVLKLMITDLNINVYKE